VTIVQSKALPDGEERLLRNKVVSAAFSGFLYIQELGFPHGLKGISPDAVSIGDVVDVVGVMRTSGGERCVDTCGDRVIVHQRR
jgi:hypothetical protein